ncbi:bifunctional ATP-dependent DNA helicase/DNA polymerase III subunit epsilon [Blautia hydrogenotrophica]|uniref:ATP-dependent DNA helicase n=1 Tax=Blautia hydrogenotrophica TaxID=53443 RepID=UPI0006C51A2A|nr:ATP-dependent DNA helicase [Blautia hydrogenotrophica]CUN03322.1 bifunctional ATP-dependent DNA helicase/DNA polymerase III subunit epsilon [Blautia hydrogenotrophica]SCH98563.1 bifunctional ATP-dependent DNA helicase/DNA polymerase III subunit epsilon [uncultured Blautia sp.]
MERSCIRISVRNLVEFILRSGDLDNRRSKMADKEAMLMGGKIHRKIQKKMESAYQAEVSLRHETIYEELSIQVEGRADGISRAQDVVLVDEIKGVYRDLARLESPVEVHEAQAKCYAYFYAYDHQQKAMQVQLTYCNMETEDIKRFCKTYTFEELELWYQKLVDEYYRWVRFQFQWRKRRDQSMEGVEFPFEYRRGQKEIVAGVYHVIQKKKQLFLQAPTGVGKTMSTVYPSVRAVGAGLAEKIFYLTAKTITRTVAQEAFLLLQEKGVEFKVATITAKEKLCLCDEMECNPQECPYARGHFDRINEAVYELWTTKNHYTRDILQEHARKWQVCPFEMCLDLSVWTDGVICDYNYVFDPNVYLKRFFAEGTKGDYIFLIDEAHNLVDRGRQMYSAALYKEEVLKIRKSLKPYGGKVIRELNRLNQFLLELKRECESYEVLESIGNLPVLLMKVMGELESFLEEPPQPEVGKEALEFYFTVRDFLNICDLLDENYKIYVQNLEDGGFQLRLFCVNPAKNLENCLEKGSCAVFFSATLLPLRYYRRVFSTHEDDYAICAASPFSQERRCLLVGADVSSKYTRRGYGEYRRIAEYIARAVNTHPGNYMVFFPSHRLLRDVYEIYEQEFSMPHVHSLCQSSVMSEQERESFLSEFQSGRGTLVGFCVMGGIFSEGIDLLGDRLIGALIVGTGIPQVGTENEILKAFYDERGENGFDYAYRYPGMNKVLQAAGRVIRTQKDRGIILLLDERFCQRENLSLFPEEWSNYQVSKITSVEKQLKKFWAGEASE